MGMWEILYHLVRGAAFGILAVLVCWGLLEYMRVF